MIQGNTVRGCNEDGYGVFVFAPYVSANVAKNTVKGCYVGLAAYGSAGPGQGPTFPSNVVTGPALRQAIPTGPTALT